MSTRRSPVLRLVVLGPSRPEASERVFCRRRGESLTVAECQACDAWLRRRGDDVECESTPERTAPDPDGERTAVGSLLCQGATVLAIDASIDDARRLLRDGATATLVDASGRVVGVVDASAVTGPWLDPALAHTPRAIMESTPVRGALRLLASAHLRQATIVTANGEPLGTFRDVDGLRWLAQARRTKDDDE